jgi:hypothetical protein
VPASRGNRLRREAELVDEDVDAAVLEAVADLLQFYVDCLRSEGRRPPRQPLVAVEAVVGA